jgi:putative transposase
MGRGSKYSEEKKLEVVVGGLKSNGSVAELCRKHGISDALYYRWKDQFMEGGKRALAGRLQSVDGELKQKVVEYEQMIGKLTVQNETLKKTFVD